MSPSAETSDILHEIPTAGRSVVAGRWEVGCLASLDGHCPMPLVVGRTQYDSEGPAHDTGSGPLSVRILRILGVELSVSAIVFFALAGLVASIAASGAGADPGVTSAAMIGLGVWFLGWLSQIVLALISAVVFGLRIHEMSLGIFGLEWRPHRWSAWRQLAWVLAAWSGPMLGGLIFLLAAVWVGSDVRHTVGLWVAPSLGPGESDAVYLAAAWLLFFQALCQACPLPGTLGRQGLVASVAVMMGRRPLPDQVTSAHIIVRAIGLVLLAGATVWLFRDWGHAYPRGLTLVVLGVLIAVSTRSRSTADALSRMKGPEPGYVSDETRTLLRRWRDFREHRESRRRLIRVAELEHQEASDASRLDAILERLRGVGADALTEDERGVLQRVSERLRRIRQSEGEE